MKSKLTIVLMTTMFLLTKPFLFSQCSAEWQDSLYMGFDLHLTASALSGTPPYTFQFYVSASGGVPINPIYTSSSGDTVIISASDMFSAWGCVNVRLCMQDGIGCNTCMTDSLADTLFTEAIICYSAFSYFENPPGSGDVMISFGSTPPDFVGQTLVQWTNGNGNSEVTPVFGGVTFIDYTAAAYNPSGYDIPVCATTFFPNTGQSCYYCDTIHLEPQTMGFSSTDQNLNLRVYPNPVDEYITISTDASTEILNISVYTIEGRKVDNSVTYYLNDKLDVRGLNPGVYLLLVETDEGNITRKIIKN